MLSEIKNHFSGELYYKSTIKDNALKRVYATDASEYQEMPEAVAIPKDIKDIKTLIDYANKYKKHLIPRAAGTSLAGQVVGNGIVVDISKHFTQIIEINQKEKWVRVQPGVIRDDLNAALKPFGLMFGPETSTANRAMIGGMIGNNSCGLHSIIWGSTRDQLLECKALLSDGSEVTFGEVTESQFFDKCNLQTKEGALYQKIYSLLTNEDNKKAIADHFPSKNIKRRNTGYALDALLDQLSFDTKRNFNFSKLIAGSEGTLCFITEAKLKLIDLPPAAVGMVAIHTASIHEALLANLVALDHQCAASELVDHFILEFTKTNPGQAKNRSFIIGEPKAILMVEFYGESLDELHNKCNDLIRDLKARNLGFAHPVLQGEESKKAWDVRKGGLGLLRNLPGNAKPVNLIEDFAVDPKDLPEYIMKLETLLQSHGLLYAMYAHAGAGELHVEPIIDLKTEVGVALFRKVIAETAALAKSFGGSLSGEHGDGRLRGEFIPYMMGEQCYQLFKEVKKIFDPENIFNRHKIVDAPPMDQFLRYTTNKKTAKHETVYNFSEQGGFLRMAEKCSGSGDCRKTHISGGIMCPSYMVTRNERDTTRARANMLRQFLTNEVQNPVSEHEVKEILDLCLSCKACKTECPSAVDIAKMKGEFLQAYYKKYGIPLRTRLIGNFTKQMQLASKLPGIYNFIFGNNKLRRWINPLVGFHPDRTMPHLSDTTLRKWYKKNPPEKSISNDLIVYVFCDEFTNYNDADTGIKLILLLRRLGYQPLIIDHPESGRTYLSKGLIERAKEIAITNVEKFSPLVGPERPLIGIEPSAILSFRDEYPDLMPDSMREMAKSLASYTYTFEEWCIQEIEKGKISSHTFNSEKREILVHGHCHQKALTDISISQKVLSLPENYKVSLLNTGCCGMAGSFGYEKEHYEVSQKTGELVLLPAVRNAKEDTIIAAAGTSCRHQILDGTGRTSLHPAEILYDALI